jgi:hypothetical protein
MTEALHEHFAQGRLTAEELDERLAATLTARTVGDLRAVDRDLPSMHPEPVAPRRPHRGHGFGAHVVLRVAFLALLISAIAHGGAWAVFNLIFLVAVFAVVFKALRIRRHFHQHGPPPWAGHGRPNWHH